MKIGKLDITWPTIICGVVALLAQIFCQEGFLNQIEADHMTSLGQNLGIASIAKEIINNWISNK